MPVESKRIPKLLAPAILIVSNIFLFGPFVVYQGNASEFNLSFTSVASYLLFPGLITVTIFSLTGLFLLEKMYQRYVSILLILGIMIWLQGNVLVWKYGLLDGQGIDWTKKVWRGWVDGALWVLLFIIALSYHRQIYRRAVLVTMTLFSIQLVYFGITSFQKPEIWKKNTPSSVFSTDKRIYELSSKQNVIQIILDAFQTDIFSEIIDEDPDYYKALEGFTFFKETVGSFPTTYMSIPALISGHNYKNDIPMPKFVNSTLKGKSIFNALYNEGYEIDLIGLNTDFYTIGQCSNCCEIPIPYGLAKDEYAKAKTALILDLVLFRSAPHVLKKAIYNNQQWLIQRLLGNTDYERTIFFAHNVFFQSFIDHLSVNKSKPVYKLIHLMSTHLPIVVNEDCKYAGKVLPPTRDNIKIQDKCVLNQVVEFLNKLKSLNVYQSSLIILHADHGAGKKVEMSNTNRKLDDDLVVGVGNSHFYEIVGSALPLVAIKPPNSKGPLKVSRVQTALTDLPSTISSILNIDERFNGRSMFEIAPNEARVRKFYYYKWRHENWQNDYFDHLYEYIINGSVFDKASWRLGKTYHSPKSSYRAQYIDFGSEEASHFLRSGWFFNQKDAREGYTYNIAMGNSASIFLSFPKNEAVLLTANIKSMPFDKSQHISVKVDGKEIGGWRLSAPWTLRRHSVVIKPDGNRPDVSVVEFVFSQHRVFRWSNNILLAALFESIALSELRPYRWGSTIRFGVSGNSGSYEDRGWSHPEDGFTWSDGQSASLTVPITMPKSHITLKANLFAFVGPGKVDKQTVEIMINGKRAGQWMITKPGVHEKMVFIPKSFFTNVSSLKITFNMPDAISLAQVGHNNDNRVLGIAVCSIKLTESS